MPSEDHPIIVGDARRMLFQSSRTTPPSGISMSVAGKYNGLP